MKYNIISVTFHRNGVSGVPFKLVKFVDPKIGTLNAIVSDYFFAVIDPTDPTNTLRGDWYAKDILAYASLMDKSI